MPDHYFGVGFENGRDRLEGSRSTRYERIGLNVIRERKERLRGNPFFGLRGCISYVDADDVPPPMAMDPDFQAFGREILSSGLGSLHFHDSRDVTANAFRGVYCFIQGTLFSEALGGDGDSQIYDADVRTYRELWRPGTTIAYDVRAIASAMVRSRGRSSPVWAAGA